MCNMYVLNFNEMLTYDVVDFEQPAPVFFLKKLVHKTFQYILIYCLSVEQVWCIFVDNSNMTLLFSPLNQYETSPCVDKG